ncbi:MAG: tetratricopeptide repeat protein [Lachnospiraceae bacterium]|nr:tetratricopeptide repeat protein [Lachnospiraceae bacterium]
MNCPKCGYEMGRNRRYCERCGTDVAVAERLYRLSNRYYNEGLARAQVRDLSGAAEVLRRSLEYNKRNIQARNLLGLVYFELGEAVAALSEWIISKHFVPENNLADYFINKVQSNPVKLDTINQTVKKFNQALAYAKQGNNDLAMLQLRKVVSLQPGYVRALQLLALLYIKNEEYEKARRCLLRAKKIDVANTTTLSYLMEVEQIMNPEGNSAVHTEKKIESSSYHIAPPTVSIQEDKPNYIAFITFFAGILIGIAVLYWLIVPTVRSNVKAEYASEERDYGAEIASYTTAISVLQNEKADLEDKLAKAESRIAALEKENEAASAFDPAAYEEVLLLVSEFPMIREKIAEAEEEENTEAVLDELISYAGRLKTWEETASSRRKTAAVYQEIMSEIFDKVKLYGYDYGHDLYNAAKYNEAVKYLQAVYDIGGTDADTLYFLGRSYQRAGDESKARIYLQMVVSQYPNSGRAEMARQTMDGLD